MVSKQFVLFFSFILISNSEANFIDGCIQDPNLLTNLLIKCYEYVSLRRTTTLTGELESIAMNYEVWCLLILEIDKVREIVKNPECAAWLTVADTCDGNDDMNTPAPQVPFPFSPNTASTSTFSPTVIPSPNTLPPVAPTILAVPGAPAGSSPPTPPPTTSTPAGMTAAAISSAAPPPPPTSPPSPPPPATSPATPV